MKAVTAVVATLAGALLSATLAGAATAAPVDPTLPQAEYRIQNIDVRGAGKVISNNRGSDGSPYPLYRPGTYGLSGDVRAGGTSYNGQASLTLSNDSWGTVSASAKTQQFTAGARGGLFYYFTLIGPDADFVPVTISGHGHAAADSLSGFASAYAELRVNYLDGRTDALGSVFEAFNPGDNRDYSDVINIRPNANARNGAPSISLFAAAGAGYNDDSNLGYYSGSASAFIDPLISIADPTLARLYTIKIALSDVVLVPPVSLPSVPLPASLPLFGLALGAVGLAGLSRRRTPARA